MNNKKSQVTFVKKAFKFNRKTKSKNSTKILSCFSDNRLLKARKKLYFFVSKENKSWHTKIIISNDSSSHPRIVISLKFHSNQKFLKINFSIFFSSCSTNVWRLLYLHALLCKCHYEAKKQVFSDSVSMQNEKNNKKMKATHCEDRKKENNV